MKVKGMTTSLIANINIYWPDITPTWILKLPELLDDCQERWGLTFEEPFTGLTYHYVISARDDLGREVVLKAGIPCEDFTRQVEVLKLVDGRGMVKLYNYDSYLGLMLLERIHPGKVLEYGDDAAHVVVQVMQDCWVPCEDIETFISVDDWFVGYINFAKYEEDINNKEVIELVYRAKLILDRLIDTMGERVILHGDMHHQNILSHNKGWIAIDPKGLVCEREFEPGVFLRRPFKHIYYHRQFDDMVRRHLGIISEALALDPVRIMEWTFVQAVHAIILTYEDSDKISRELFHLSRRVERFLESMSIC